jgi:hypothetical protein
MNTKLLSWRWLLILLAVLATGQAWAQTVTIPTAAQLRELYTAGQYHPCLQQISRLLFLKGAPAAGVDRAALLLLRGDCLVRLGDSRTALKAYKSAEAAAADDPPTALRARGSALILQNCRGLTFVPADAPPLDVTADDGWKQASVSLFTSTWQNSQNDLKAAQTAQDLGLIAKVVPQVTDLFALAEVSGVDDSQLVALARSIGQRGRDIIGRVLAQQSEAIANVQQNADVILSTTIGPTTWGGGSGITVRQGLSTPDRDTLSKIVDVCDQAYNVAVQGREAAFRVGGNEGKWQEVADQAAQLRDHAQDVLNAE